MRVTLVAVILAMAALGLVLAVITGRIYRDHSLSSERTLLADRLANASQTIRRQTEREVIFLASTVGAQYPNLSTTAARTNDNLEKTLTQIFSYYRAQYARPALIELGVYDAKGTPLARFTPKSSTAVTDEAWREACGSIRARLHRLGDGSMPLVSDEYCVVGDRVYHLIFVSLDESANNLFGVVSDAAHDLAAIENVLGTPIRVWLSTGALVYESSNWPSDIGEPAFLSASLPIEMPGAGEVVVEAAKDERALSDRLNQTRYAVFFAASAITLLVVLIALAFVEKVAIAPLRSLVDQLRRTQRDESQLGNRVAVYGNSEVQELAASFNDMTTRLEQLYENLDRLAFTDSLTQLPNRSLMQSQLEKAVVAARTDGSMFALFIMDLDRFKEINDTLGHQVGDVLLQQVAIRLRSKLRETDFIARMGGDEFAILMLNVTPKQVDMAARMLLQSLRAPFIIESHHLDVHTGIGIALYPDHGVDAQTLIQRADVSMYAAKQGNAGHLFYDPQMDRHHPALLTLMGELRQAVEQEQFILYYQPKIGLKSNRVVGVEALVRWRHPSGKLVMPDTFIPILEQTGLIRSLTGWVTNEALRTARELRDRGFALPIAVNISTRDLLNSGLSEDIAEQIEAHQAEAQWLELEITESAVMSDIGGAMQLLTQLAGMGFRLVIDDFGTGYSSLAYLKRLPVHTVKIDKSFVIGMAKDENDAAIVYTSIDLAHNLGLQVVAEGVDQEPTLTRLRTHGCDAAQGIYLSRPLPLEDLVEWLEKSSWGLRAEAAS